MNWEHRPFFDGREWITVFSVPGLKYRWRELEPGEYEHDYEEEGLTMTTEVRVKHLDTGGEKGSKPEKFSLIPPGPMAEVARVYGYGAGKYTPRNWERGYDWTLSLDAMERHLNAFKAREDRDPESGRHHLAHVVFHCLALMEWERTHPELDDRS